MCSYNVASDKNINNSFPDRVPASIILLSILIRYAQVSTGRQELHSQIDALKKAGVSEKLMFIDKASGAKSERPGLDSCMQELQAGDILVIWGLNSLGLWSK